MRVPTFQTSGITYHEEDEIATREQSGTVKLAADEWADNRIADFNLWITGIGALAAR